MDPTFWKMVFAVAFVQVVTMVLIVARRMYHEKSVSGTVSGFDDLAKATKRPADLHTRLVSSNAPIDRPEIGARDIPLGPRCPTCQIQPFIRRFDHPVPPPMAPLPPEEPPGRP